MGDSVADMLQYLCRLCARTDRSCVNVFSDVGDKLSIQKKIRLCLPVIVVEQDEMPRQICLSCLNKLESTYEFYSTCISSQSTIQRLLKARSMDDNDNVNKPDSETKENILTSFSLDQFLKRKIEVADSGTSCKVQKTDKLEKDLTDDNAHVRSARASDTDVGTTEGNINGSVVTTNNSEFQSVATGGGSNSSSPTSAETQKPKLRVKTTSELTQPGPTSTVTDCLSAHLSLPGPSAQSASVPTSRQSTCVSASHSTSVVFSQGSHTTSSVSPHVKNSLLHHVTNSSALNGTTVRSPVVQNAKSVSPVLQFSRNSSAPQSIGSSPSVLRYSTGSSSALQTATSPLSALQNVTALLPMPKNAAVSLPVTNTATVTLPVSKNAAASLNVPNNTSVSLSVPQNVTNASSLQQYSLSVPTSLSPGCTIVPNMSQFIIVPNSFPTTPTFTAAGTNTVTVLTQPLPSNVSLVGDLGVPLGSATASVSTAAAVPLASASLPLVRTMPLQVTQQLSNPVMTPVTSAPAVISQRSTSAVPLASSSLPLVRTVPLPVTQQLSNPVMTPATSAPAVISRSSTSGSASFNVLRKSNQEIVITTDSRATASTSAASVISRADGQQSTPSQNLKVSRSSPVGSTGSKAPAARLGAEGKTAGLRGGAAVRGSDSAASTILLKRNGGVWSRTNAVTVSRAVSQPTILPKPAPSVVDTAKNMSHTSSILQSQLVYTVSVQDSKKGASAKPAKTSSQGSNSQDSDVPKTVLTYSRQSATKAICLPTDKSTKATTTVSLPQGTVVTPVSSVNSTYSVSVGPAQQQKEGTRSVVIQKINNSSAGNRQLPTAGVETESQRSESQTQPKAAATRPPPPPTVRLDSVSATENRRKLPNNESVDLQNGEAKSTSGHQVDRGNSQKQGVKNVEAPQNSGISSGHQVNRENPQKQGLKNVEAPKNSGISSGHQVNRENPQKQGLKNVEAPKNSGISNRATTSELKTKPRGPVVTATVKPFTPTAQPAADGGGQSPGGPSPEEVEVEEVEVEPLTAPPAAGRSPTAAEEPKEECPYCHVEFPPALLIHHKALHYREKFYSCIDCDKNFVTEKGLETHRCHKESKG